jgi:hypothetical protein
MRIAQAPTATDPLVLGSCYFSAQSRSDLSDRLQFHTAMQEV